jgi:hypothetical protein
MKLADGSLEHPMGGMFSENAAIKKHYEVEFASSAAEALASSTTVLREMLKLVA